VVFQLLEDEYGDIKAIECISCDERWYVDIRSVTEQRNHPALAEEDTIKHCLGCGREFFRPMPFARYCSKACWRKKYREDTGK
jgi:hypothetical protein